LFAFFLIYCASSFATVTKVELVKCAPDAGCAYQAEFPPSGNLGANQWIYYSVDLSDLIFNSSNSLILNPSLQGPSSTLNYYIRKTNIPDANNFSDMKTFICNSTFTCYDWTNFGVGVCDPSKKTYIFGIQNPGSETSFGFDIQVRGDIAFSLECIFFNFFTTVVIIIFSVVGGCCLICIFGCVLVCVCSRRRSHHNYTQVTNHHAIPTTSPSIQQPPRGPPPGYQGAPPGYQGAPSGYQGGPPVYQPPVSGYQPPISGYQQPPNSGYQPPLGPVYQQPPLYPSYSISSPPQPNPPPYDAPK